MHRSHEICQQETDDKRVTPRVWFNKNTDERQKCVFFAKNALFSYYSSPAQEPEKMCLSYLSHTK
uniref:Uncharacterized protein n=1 Tax=Romanomermis culicivorax TaxID=13658 RepID=A0A915JAQ9_ROMCU